VSKETPRTYCSTIAPFRKQKTKPVPNAAEAFSASCDEYNITLFGFTQTEANAKLEKERERRKTQSDIPKAIFNRSINP